MLNTITIVTIVVVLVKKRIRKFKNIINNKSSFKKKMRKLTLVKRKTNPSTLHRHLTSKSIYKPAKTTREKKANSSPITKAPYYASTKLEITRRSVGLQRRRAAVRKSYRAPLGFFRPRGKLTRTWPTAFIFDCGKFSSASLMTEKSTRGGKKVEMLMASLTRGHTGRGCRIDEICMRVRWTNSKWPN